MKSIKFKKKILVMDDEELIRETLGCVLREEGYDVVTAGDGVEGLEFAYQEEIDLVILDVTMPEMDGYQVCRLLKSDNDYNHIPIIMLTSKDKKFQRFWGLKAGADRYVIKPFEPEELLKMISQVLNKE
ncbi:MAG: response regulator [bacterium]